MKTIVLGIPRLRSRLAMVPLLLGLIATGYSAAAAIASQAEVTPYAGSWAQSRGISSIDDFNAWVARYTNANTAARIQLAPEGVRLAQKRRSDFVQLMVANPRKALASTLPAVIVQQLPAEVLDEVESHVAGVGDLIVQAFLPATHGPAVTPIKRSIRLNGQTLPAYVYGRRSSQTTKYGIPLHGILLNGVLALHENALRELEPGEQFDPAKTIVDLRTASQKGTLGEGGIFAEMDGKIYLFASSGALRQAEARLEASEAGFAPTPKAPAASVVQEPGALTPHQQGDGSSADPGTAWTTGFKKVLYIRVDFDDLAGDPVGYGLPSGTQAAIQNLADQQVSPYYLQSSYGLTWMSNTVSTVLYRMPQTAASYAASGNNDQLHLDAETLASANYDLTTYDRIVVVFSNLGNLPNSQITYGGLANLGGTNVWVNGDMEFRVLAHELGHTYGLYHAALWQVTDGNPLSSAGTAIEYGDDFDTMGANFANTTNTDFSTFNKNVLGWLPDSKVATITSNGVYRVYASDWINAQRATNAHILALNYVKDSSRTYWIGVRRNFTDNAFMENGVSIIWSYSSVGAGGGGGFNTALLDLNTPGDAPAVGFATDYDSALGLGVPFSDPGAGLLVTPIAEGGTFPNEYVDIQVGNGAPEGPDIVVKTNFISGGNGNGFIDFDECNNLTVVLSNSGKADATGVRATLSTMTPNVAILQPVSAFPDLPVGAAATNSTLFRISTTPDFACGTPILLQLVVKCDQNTVTNFITETTGTPGKPLRFDSPFPVAIPDSGRVTSSISVSNVAFAVNKVTVSMFIQHTFDSDLLLQLIAPDGTVCTLSANNGGGGQNYGISCSPEVQRTTFDDDATTRISNGFPPFLGSFRPETPLSVFTGTTGTNVNGVWQLRVADQAPFDVGTLMCWSLSITPTLCVEGGGECPGADLVMGMTAQPDPASVGGVLTYSLNITNLGPSTATNVSASLLLPGPVSFISASASQGSYTASGGVVTFNLGRVSLGGVASATVLAQPNLQGDVTSTATVASEQIDPNPANNSVTLTTHINPPTADISIGLTASPPRVFVGSPLTYTVEVTNNGPQAASGVMVTNLLPADARVASVSISRGSAPTNLMLNPVVCTVGSLEPSARSTITITVVPTNNIEEVLVATSSVGASQFDPKPANNSATLSIGAGPAADLGIVRFTALPDPVVTGSEITYTLIATNSGPSFATSAALSVVIPASASITSAISSQGVVAISSNLVLVTLGNIQKGADATIVIKAKTTVNGPLTATASITGAQSDPNTGNNSMTATATAAAPFINIVPSAVTLTAESGPVDGAIDNGETVTVNLFLRNAGNVANTNLVATLLATGGVTPVAPNTPQTYGRINAGGVVVRPFSFTANGVNGGTITATLQLSDGGNALTNNAVFTFTLPNVFSFTNSSPITIRDDTSALPYPSTISVSNVTGTVSKVTASLFGFSHTFTRDVSALLQGPTSVDALLLSHAGFGAVTGLTLNLDDTATNSLPSDSSLLGGTWKPTAYATDYAPVPVFPTPAPAGPYSTALSAFNGANANGTWSLFVMDDFIGDEGSINGGWSVSVTTITPVNHLSDVSVTVSNPPSPVMLGAPLTYTVTITNGGPSTASVINFTNQLSASVTAVTATSPQMSLSVNGGLITGTLVSLSTGATATVTVTLTPAVAGTLTSFVSVNDTVENDLNPLNNTVSKTISVVAPAVNLGLAQTISPVPGVVGFNVTNTITLTNASSNPALSVVVTDPLPAGSTFVSAGSSVGIATNASGVVTFNLGDIPANGVATLNLVVSPSLTGTLTNTASVSTISANAGMTTISQTDLITGPFPIIVAAGRSLTSESGPVNDAVDPGETVTIALTLRNSGTAATSTNFSATLVNSGGVTASSGTQVYGAIAPGASASANYTFTAANSGSLVTAVLQLQDGTNSLGSATFVFNLPTTGHFSSTTGIIIPDHGPANPYPSSIVVSGMTGLVSKATVTLNGFTHSFPHDVSAVLVSPSGVDVLLMAHTGAGYPVTNLTLTFDDAAGTALPQRAALSSGTNRPTAYDGTPTFTTLSVPNLVNFLADNAGGNPNGTWSLYVLDDSAGDSGLISGGWSLDLTTVTTLDPVADMGLQLTSSPASLFVGGTITNTLTVTNGGPMAATGVTVTYSLPAGVTFVGAYPAGISTGPVSGLVTCNLGALALGSSSNLSVVVAPSVSGSITNTFTVSALQKDIFPGNNVVSAIVLATAPITAQLTNYVSKGELHIDVLAQAGLSYRIEGSTNFSSWTPVVVTNAAPDGTISITDTNFPALSHRFYRAVRVFP